MDTESNPSHKQKHFSPVSFVGGLLIALLVCGIVYMLISGRHKSDNSTAEQNSDLKKDSSIFGQEHFYRTHHHTHIDRDAEPIVLMPEEESMLEKGNPTDRER